MSMTKDNDNRFRIFAAPVQGLTECAWRHYHHELLGEGIDAYFTPFLRIERGEVRRRDVRDILSPLNADVPVIPQIIFRDMDEFVMLCKTVRDVGYRSIDINMGCPFPPQVHHGRGAGMMSNLPLHETLAEVMSERFHDIRFSLKMRLGIDSPSEWHRSIEAIDSLPLTHVTIHARTVRQQYGGEPAMDEFAELLRTTRHPVVYNGDILAPADIDRLREAYSSLAGVMIGRGLFSRPGLAAEWTQGEEWPASERGACMMRLHDAIYGYYLEHTEGESQLLGKIKPFWDYLRDADRRTLKLLKKATTIAKYNQALLALRQDLTGGMDGASRQD